MAQRSLFVLPTLLVLQFLIYLDRGIIPGSISEINQFILKSLDTRHPDIYLGLLQSSFVVGLSVSCPIIAHLSHRISSFGLISSGIAVWMIGGWMAGISYHVESYLVFLFGRILSGVGEAALISLVPPIIMEEAEGGGVGIWMGCFCSMIPIGTAAGYCYGSLLANSIEGWGTAFVIEAAIAIPFVIIFGILATLQKLETPALQTDSAALIDSSRVLHKECPEFASPVGLEEREMTGRLDSRLRDAPLMPLMEHPRLTSVAGGRYVSFTRGTGCLSAHSDTESNAMTPLPEVHEEDRDLTATPSPVARISFKDDFCAVIASPAFIWIAVAYSAYSAAVAGFSTFGAAFLMNLGFLGNETIASLSMGVSVATAGIVGSLIGGFLASRASSEKHVAEQPVEASEEDVWPEAVVRLTKVDEDHSLEMKNSKPEDASIDSWALKSRSELLELHQLLSMILPVLTGSILMLCLSALLNSLWAFLFAVGIGMTGLFATQAGMNIATMLSVPEAQRTCSIAIVTLLLHLTGDVPSPIVVGFIKDMLAPACNNPGVSSPALTAPSLSINLADDVGNNGTRGWNVSTAGSSYGVAGRLLEGQVDSCQDQSFGIRVTMFLTMSWLVWMIVGVRRAKLYTMNELEKFPTSQLPTQTEEPALEGVADSTAFPSNEAHSSVEWKRNNGQFIRVVT